MPAYTVQQLEVQRHVAAVVAPAAGCRMDLGSGHIDSGWVEVLAEADFRNRRRIAELAAVVCLGYIRR